MVNLNFLKQELCKTTLIKIILIGMRAVSDLIITSNNNLGILEHLWAWLHGLNVLQHSAQL